MAWQVKAAGHVCQVNLFDKETATIPFNKVELDRLYFALSRNIDLLAASGDFPEAREYKALLSNIQAAQFLLSPMNKKGK